MSSEVPPESWHRRTLEHRAGLFAVLTTIAISIGGMAEIIPMIALGDPADAARIQPYTPLELAGRDIYVREGCYNCHSQMIRPFRAETLRYGEWSRSWEVIYDRPFQLGSRRIGPDLARIGGKYPDAWHWEHMMDPRATSPGSMMPIYPWLYTARVDVEDVRATVVAMRRVGVPYSEEEVAQVATSVAEQQAVILGSLSQMNVEAEPDLEIVALIAYLQRLGKDGSAELAGASGTDGGGA